LPTDWLVEAYRVLKDNAAIYIFAHWSKWGELQSAAQVAGFIVKNMIVLDKSNHGMGATTLQYAPKHELVLFASKGKHILLNPDGRKPDVWNVPVKFSGSHKFHPNEKPASWIHYAIINSSIEDQVILDPFMGSGSFGIASIKSKRQFIGIESNVQYFDIAKARIDAAMNETDVNLF
jgi:site-specific DNA-methyltransferase (adenine-specific)